MFSTALRNKKIIGVDPSLSQTGLAILKNKELGSYRCIITNKKATFNSRLYFIAVELFEYLEAEKPDIMAIETQYIHVISNSVLKVSEVKGVLEGVYYAYCFRHKLKPEIIEVSPMEAKSAVGVQARLKRNDSKQAVKKMVGLMYSELRKKGIEQDIYDAVSIAVAGQDKYLSPI